MTLNFNDPFAHGAYLLWDGGTFKFDCVDEQNVERTGEIVEHPVEVGAPVSDHYRVQMRRVKLTGFVSQEPVDPSLYPDMAGSLQSVEYVLPEYPTPSLAGTLTTAVQDPSSLIVKSLAKKPPTRFSDYVLKYDNPQDILAIVEALFDDLMASATLIDVATRSKYYPQHLIESVVVKRNFGTGTGAAVDLQLKQVRFVSTKAVAAPPEPVKPKDKPNADKGKQNPTPPPLKSGLAKLTDYANGPLSKFVPSGGATNFTGAALLPLF